MSSQPSDPDSTTSDITGEADPALVDALRMLEKRLERLERAECAREFHPWYTNAAFEDVFRGSHDQLRDHYREVAALLAGRSPVVDIGCGRGEFLELLDDLGIQAHGVEIDPALVEECRDRGLDAEVADCIAHLESLADGSLGGLSAIQVIEHLTAQQQVDLVRLAHSKLEPGGIALVETVNPTSVSALAQLFYIDPTHARPVHPSYLQFLFAQAGFQRVDVAGRSTPPADQRLAAVGIPNLDENFERLNQLLYGPRDYVVVAVR
jgi:O-antigen chain-terminating methyltransferase